MPDCAHGAERRRSFLDQVLDVLETCIRRLQSIRQTAKVAQPSRCLRQRHLDVPASAFPRLPDTRHDRSERHEVTGGMIESLRRQLLRSCRAEGLRFRDVEAACGLHQRIEAAPIGPWALMPVGAQRGVDDAGLKPGRVLR